MTIVRNDGAPLEEVPVRIAASRMEQRVIGANGARNVPEAWSRCGPSG